MPYCTDGMIAHPQHQVLLVCLGIGLVLRDLHVIQFDLGEGEDVSGDIDPAIKHLQKSKLEWAHTQVLLPICISIAEDLRTCLDEGKAPEALDRYGFDTYLVMAGLIGMIVTLPSGHPQGPPSQLSCSNHLTLCNHLPKSQKKRLSGMKFTILSDNNIDWHYSNPTTRRYNRPKKKGSR